MASQRTKGGRRNLNQTFQEIRRRVGSTPLKAVPALGRELQIPNLFVKIEGANPTGSVDDRWSVVQVEEALRRNLTTLTVASDGREAASLAWFASAAGLTTVLHLDQDSKPPPARASEVRILRTGVDLEARVKASRAEATAPGWLDANRGPDASERAARAFGPIAQEIFQAMGKLPRVVAVPTRHGSTVAGIAAGFAGLGTGPSPRLLAASTKMGNPIIWSLARRDHKCVDLESRDVWPSETSRALATYHALDGDAAMEAVKASDGWGYASSDEELEAMAARIKRVEGLEVLPAAAAGVAALHFAARLDRLDAAGTHLAVLTARP